jgi:hypothetical protein
MDMSTHIDKAVRIVSWADSTRYQLRPMYTTVRSISAKMTPLSPNLSSHLRSSFNRHFQLQRNLTIWRNIAKIDLGPPRDLGRDVGRIEAEVNEHGRWLTGRNILLISATACCLGNHSVHELTISSPARTGVLHIARSNTSLRHSIFTHYRSA